MKKHNLLTRLGKIIIGLFIFLIILAYAYWIHPVLGGFFSFQHGQKTPITPAWALECWVWEDDVNTAAAVWDILDGYRQYDFPVRTILIDSPWSTRYNDFQVDEKRFPHPQQFFGKLDSLGYRVVLWMTCMVDRENDDTAIRDASQWFDEARQRGFLANGGK
ncbi:MAG: glycoside hydrolase family 31 protein, partial [Actinobacteria bacterium]|nr:glycoside hydrolase family 31 protein [Actinomycetota bacterium]